MKVAVIGAGSWGSTVASLTAANCPTVLWARRPEVALEIAEQHTNERYLPGFSLPAELEATSDLARAVGSADVLVMAVPSHGFRAVAKELAAFVRPWIPIVSLTKGVEQDTLLRMTQVVDEVVSVLDPDRQPEEVVGHLERRAGRRGMGHRSRVLDQALDGAERLGEREDLGRVGDAHRRVSSGVHGE